MCPGICKYKMQKMNLYIDLQGALVYAGSKCKRFVCLERSNHVYDLSISTVSNHSTQRWERRSCGGIRLHSGRAFPTVQRKRKDRLCCGVLSRSRSTGAARGTAAHGTGFGNPQRLPGASAGGDGPASCPGFNGRSGVWHHDGQAAGGVLSGGEPGESPPANRGGRFRPGLGIWRRCVAGVS